MTGRQKCFLGVLFIAVVGLGFWVNSLATAVNTVKGNVDSANRQGEQAIRETSDLFAQLDDLKGVVSFNAGMTNVNFDGAKAEREELGKRLSVVEKDTKNARADARLANKRILVVGAEVTRVKGVAVAAAVRADKAMEIATGGNMSAVTVSAVTTVTPMVKAKAGNQSVEIKKDKPTDVVRITWFTKNPCKK